VPSVRSLGASTQLVSAPVFDGKPQLADDSNGDTFVLAPLNVTTETSQNEHLVVRKWSKARAFGKAITVGTAASTVTVTNVADGPALAADGCHTRGRSVPPSGSAPVTSRISPSPRPA
jgi:hypothetical protein